MKKYLILPLLFLTNFVLKAQDFSNKGKEFWIAYPAHANETGSMMGIYLACDQSATATVQVRNSTKTFTIAPNKVTRVLLGSTGNVDFDNSSVYLSTLDGVTPNTSIKVTSNIPIVVYAHIIRNARSGATLVLPTQVLGTEYMVTGYQSVGNPSPQDTNPEQGEFVAIATKDSTTISFTPTIKGSGNNGKAANGTYTVTLLKAGDTYQFQGVAGGDISGTVVKSISTTSAGCKPIAVFAASTWSAFDCSGPSGGDNLYQQLFPIRSWGKKFITSPFIYRDYDIFRIYVNTIGTTIKVTENGIQRTLPQSQYNSINKFYQLKTKQPLLIESDQPISVAQFMTSLTCSRNCITPDENQECAGDPEMIVLNPIEQTLKNITFYSADADAFTGFNGITNVAFHYVNIIIDKKYKNTLKIDGAAPAASFIDIPGTNYSYIQEDVTRSSAINPTHNVVADTGFTAIVYGTGRVESYGYNGGTNVLDLYQFISLKNPFTTVNFPATCVGTNFNLSITLPYQPLKLNWDFGGNPNLIPNTNIINNNPVFDSSYVKDGKTLFQYRIPGNYVFSKTGNYPVKVLVDNPTPDGCNGVQEISYEMQVFDPPVTNFNVNFDGCLGNTAQFQYINNLGGRPTIKWFWDFGDNTNDTIANPNKNFSTANSFKVSLKTINEIGCISDTFKTVAVTSLPIAKLIINKADSICANSTVTFIDSSSVVVGNIAKWTINYGNGKTNVFTSNPVFSTIYTDTGKYTVSLVTEIGTGCKSNVFTKEIYVRAAPIVKFDLPIAACLPNAIATFINNSSINSYPNDTLKYKWYFGNNDSSILKNGTTTYNSTGNFNVKLIATSNYGCVAENITGFSNIFQKPIANFGFKNEICIRDTSFFIDSSKVLGSNIIKWSYDFGDGNFSSNPNPINIYLTAKKYYIKLNVSTDKGCSDTKLDSIIVNPLPTPAFSISSLTCEKQDITFNDLSTPNAGILTQWGFSMGDGAFQTFFNSLPSFNYKYDTTGIYFVKLVVTNSKGCVSDSSAPFAINIKPKPNVGVILPEVCLDDAFAQFFDTSKIADNSNNFSYLWNFGDKNASVSNPNFSTIQNPKHSYSDTGIYKVKILVTSINGCADSLTQDFTVNGSTPKANYNIIAPSALCSNDSVGIINTSSVDFGNITKIEIYWDTAGNLNHKSIIQDPKPNRIYKTLYQKFTSPVSKDFYVKMISYSGETCKDSFTQKITIVQAPQVRILPIKSICKEASPRIINEASDISGIAGLGVFSGVGITNSSTGLFDPSKLNANQKYPIKYLFTTSNFNCKDSATDSIKILPSPVARFTTSSLLCEKNNFDFIINSTSSVGNLIEWKWDFGDNNNATYNNGSIFNYNYNSSKNYVVSLTVKSDSGCINTATNNVFINPLPKVSFTIPKAICLPNGNADFKDSTFINGVGQSPLSRQWFFNFYKNNDGSTMLHPSYKYLVNDSPTVKLIVTSAKGCIDSTEKKLLNIYPQPKANFTVLPDTFVCITDALYTNTLKFIDKSNGISSAVNNWSWTFDNLGTTTLQNPIFNFTDSGNKKITLLVQNIDGCSSEPFTKTVVVYPYPIVKLPKKLNFLQGSFLNIIPIQVHGKNPKYLWTINNNDILFDTALIATVNPTDDKQFKLTVTNEANCATSDTVRVIVLRLPVIPTAFSPNGDGINDLWIIENLEKYPSCSVEVFDRFGKSVYVSTIGYSRPWNGRYFNTGADLATGVYYYIIRPENGRQPITGNITLMR